MRCTPMDEKAYTMRNVWPAGWYSATISDAEDGVVEKTSQNGNQFFQTQVNVYTPEGGHKLVRAIIMASGKAEWQLRSAAEAFGVLEKYRAGEILPDDLRGRSAWVKLAVEEDKTGQYEPKNIIRDYRKDPPKGFTKPAEPQPTDKELDDSIPF